MKPNPRFVVALDIPDQEKALSMAQSLSPYVGMFKVGKALFTRYGPDIVKRLVDLQVDVFLDLKFHDIPNTVAMAAREATQLGVRIFNVHTLGGIAMMKAAKEASLEASPSNHPPLCLGVTLLTSHTEKEVQEDLRIPHSMEDQVLHLAHCARNAGLDGVVASPMEIKPIREKLGSHFIILTPGIRPQGAVLNDQKRVLTPGEALKQGANYIVVGRPVIHSEDPVRTAAEIHAELAGVT